MILKFSIPAAISLLISAIYNIVDRIFVGNFVGTSALAGLSICFPLSYMMMAFGLMCSAGGASLFSLFAGQREQNRMNASFGNAFGMVVVFELVLTVFLQLLANPILQVFGVTQTAYPYAIAYYRIVALGCVFQGLTQVFCDFVRVSGLPVLGMCVTGVGAVTNIILDAVFVAGLGWGVTGAAWATVIGQVLSVVFGASLIWRGKTLVEIKAETFRFDAPLAQKILSCGFAFWIAQMAMGLISLVYNSQLGKYGGDNAISVYAVVASIIWLYFYLYPPADGKKTAVPAAAYAAWASLFLGCVGFYWAGWSGGETGSVWSQGSSSSLITDSISPNLAHSSGENRSRIRATALWTRSPAPQYNSYFRVTWSRYSRLSSEERVFST